MQAGREQAAFGVVGGEGQGAGVGGGGLVVAAEAGEQLGAGGVEEVVAVEPVGELVDGGQRTARPARGPICDIADGAVEADDG